MARIFDDTCGDTYDWAKKLVWWSTGGDSFNNPNVDGNVETGIFGSTGNCLRIQRTTNSQYAYLRKNFGSDYSRLIYGCRFKTQTIPVSGYCNVAGLWDNTATPLNLLAYDSSGSVSIWWGGYPLSGGTHVGNFSVPNIIQSDTWVYLEIDLTLDSTSSGAFVVRANSQPILTASSIRTSPNVNGARMFSVYSGGPTNGGLISHYFDDIYVNDTSGTSNNGFDGDQQMLYFPPTAPGQFSQQTIGGSSPAATNWQSVNQTVPDDDTTYVYAASTGLKDTYKVAALPSNVSSIVSVTTILDAKTDTSGLGGGATIRPLIGNGVSHANGTSVSVNTSYIDKAQFWGQNPLTSAAWSLSDWSNIEIGHERTA